MTPRLSVRALSKRLPDGRLVLDDVSFDLGAGEVVALVGESGSGKSTLAKALAGLVPADVRGVQLDGEPLRRAGTRVQMVFQDPFASLNPVHTIEHHIVRPLARRRPDSKARLRDEAALLLAAVGLDPALAARHPHALSGGQRQRIAVARALAAGPDVILADEPTSMLDVSTRLGVLKLLRRLADERRLAILLITHDLPSAAAIADRVLTMYAGRIIEAGATATVLRTPAHPYTRLLLDAAPRGERFVPSMMTPPVHPSASHGSPGAAHASGAARAGAGGAEPGCAFAARCPSALAVCRAKAPAERLVAPGHLVRCHLFHEGALRHASLP